MEKYIIIISIIAATTECWFTTLLSVYKEASNLIAQFLEPLQKCFFPNTTVYSIFFLENWTFCLWYDNFGPAGYPGASLGT